jgi:hypothetical protein
MLRVQTYGGDRPMSVTGINSIWFHTPDIERLRRFYIELLGAEPLMTMSPFVLGTLS